MRNFSWLILLALVCVACQASPVPPPEGAPSPAKVSLTVFFTNLPNYQVGTEPYETAVNRLVPMPASLPEAVLSQLFLGPTEAERAQGLDVVLSGATGFNKFNLDDGVARVYLDGSCASNGATYTIANLIFANLVQFPEIQWIKIYDQNNETETPEGQSGSIPFCLEP
jgi:hypothetical protein